MQSLHFSSELRAPASSLLDTLTMSGVNRELRPYLRMSAPAAYAQRNILDWPAKEPLFASWILLFGLLPIDRHSFYFTEITPEYGFVERSSSLVNAVWEHRRQITVLPNGCRVTDTVEFSSRIPFLEPLFTPIYQRVFRGRHSKLRQAFGRCTSPT